MNIEKEMTPNPNALKFIVPNDLTMGSKLTFYSKKDSEDLPLVNYMFDNAAVRQVYIYNNMMTITKAFSEDWENLEPHIAQGFDKYLSNHNPNYQIKSEDTTEKVYTDSHLIEINDILDRTIRPNLQMDGGDLDLVEYDQSNKLLKVQYQGACGTCPSSTTGTLYAIENILKDEYDKEINVILQDA